MKGYNRRIMLNGEANGVNINDYIVPNPYGENIEGVADVFSYKTVNLLLPNITTDVEVKRYITKFILFMTCGDRTVLGHVDTMMRSNYIRYIPEFDGSIPQDNAHYKIS